MNEIKLGKYKHFRGKVYEVVAIAKHSETKEELVIYKDEQGNVWARPKEMFFEEVDKPEYRGPRFKYLD
jgi:hypothetical protein